MRAEWHAAVTHEGGVDGGSKKGDIKEAKRTTRARSAGTGWAFGGRHAAVAAGGVFLALAGESYCCVCETARRHLPGFHSCSFAF